MSDSTEKSGVATTKLVVALLLAAAALVFVFSNMAEAKLKFLMIEIAMPGWVWLIVLFGAGVIVGSLFPWFSKKKK